MDNRDKFGVGLIFLVVVTSALAFCRYCSESHPKVPDFHPGAQITFASPSPTITPKPLQPVSPAPTPANVPSKARAAIHTSLVASQEPEPSPSPACRLGFLNYAGDRVGSQCLEIPSGKMFTALERGVTPGPGNGIPQWCLDKYVNIPCLLAVDEDVVIVQNCFAEVEGVMVPEGNCAWMRLKLADH